MTISLPVAPIVHLEAGDAAPTDLPRSLRLLFRILTGIRYGRLTVTVPDGRRFRFIGPEPGADAALIVHRPRWVRRSILGGTVGFAESYIDGDWSTPNLPDFLELMCGNESVEAHHKGRKLAMLLHRVYHGLRRNTPGGSKRNIAAHYDLGNAFYEYWLDPSMTYSSAVFPARGADLAAAQLHKYRLVCEKLDLSPGQRLLEIGCGWGAFASFAAREYGARVTAITVSRQQLDYVQARIQREGLGERVEARFTDYRDLEGRFDRVASIEMLEAVGEKYWPRFFAKLRDSLQPGGRAALQVITIADRLFEPYRRGVDFIQRYIFPGGMLPSAVVLGREIARAGLMVERQEFFGPHYARTMALWQERFQAAWADIRPLGFDQRFKRLWEFYLAYCEAGFRTQSIDVTQVAVSRG